MLTDILRTWCQRW